MKKNKFIMPKNSVGYAVDELVKRIILGEQEEVHELFNKYKRKFGAKWLMSFSLCIQVYPLRVIKLFGLSDMLRPEQREAIIQMPISIRNFKNVERWENLARKRIVRQVSEPRS